MKKREGERACERGHVDDGGVGGGVLVTKHGKTNHETVQTFMTIKKESKGRDKSIKRTETRRHAISNR